MDSNFDSSQLSFLDSTDTTSLIGSFKNRSPLTRIFRRFTSESWNCWNFLPTSINAYWPTIDFNVFARHDGRCDRSGLAAKSFLEKGQCDWFAGRPPLHVTRFKAFLLPHSARKRSSGIVLRSQSRLYLTYCHNNNSSFCSQLSGILQFYRVQTYEGERVAKVTACCLSATQRTF